MLDHDQAYQQSNHHKVAFQILLNKAPKEMFQYQQLNSNTVTQRRDDDIALTTVPTKWMMNNQWPEITILNDLAKWCAMPNGELENHIDWCLKRFADYTDYVDHDLYSSHSNNAQIIPYHAVALPVTSFHCDKQAVHMVHCSGSTM